MYKKENNLKKAIIYGLGQRYYDEFFNNFIIPIIKKRYEIVGVSDKVLPKFLPQLPFINRSELYKRCDEIIITSDRFYAEIKNELSSLFPTDCSIVFHSLEDIEKEIIGPIIQRNYFAGKIGVEIGGPSRFFATIYDVVQQCDGVNFSDNTVWFNSQGTTYSYKNRPLGEVIIADAVDLSVIPSSKYDFCISCNNLEHIANPLKSISELIRVCKSGGIILIVAPNKDTCFDHNRPITSMSHLISDYMSNIGENDLTHLDEIIALHDYKLDSGIQDKKFFINRAQHNFENRCLHHHVFDVNLLNDIFSYLNLSTIKSGTVYNNHFILGLKK